MTRLAAFEALLALLAARGGKVFRLREAADIVVAEVEAGGERFTIAFAGAPPRRGANVVDLDERRRTR